MVEILKYKYRHYKCSVCGHEMEIKTNHEEFVLNHCPGCSSDPSQGNAYAIPALGEQIFRRFNFVKGEE
jgi:DNA-directed RNA polymerase subunit RPC12/RpoP